MDYERYETGLREFCESVLEDVRSIVGHSNDTYRTVDEWLADQTRWSVATDDSGNYLSALVTVSNEPEVQIGTKDRFIRGFWKGKVFELPIDKDLNAVIDKTVRKAWEATRSKVPLSVMSLGADDLPGEALVVEPKADKVDLDRIMRWDC